MPMAKLGIRCVRHAVSVAALTGFGKAACASLLLVLSCVLSPAFAQAFEGNGCTAEMKVKEGSGTEAKPYEIRTLCQLQDISSNLTAHYELVADIDASETKDWNDGAGFESIPLGGFNSKFSGSFVNAGTHEIRSLTISLSRSYTHKVGLFSELARGATIRGIILVGSRTTGGDYTGGDYVGSLVGYNAGVIEDCSATGSISGKEYVGGLVGYNTGDINNSYVASTVTGYYRVGGLVGTNTGDINNSYVVSTVTGSFRVGGLVGSNWGGISNSYATGSVSGKHQDVGGLVGTNTGDINNSYATGQVSGGENVGGLVGYGGGDISNSYATGSVSGQRNVGGLVGLNDGVISNSYATGFVYGFVYEVEIVGGLVGSRRVSGNIRNSYYAARGRNNSLGDERSFAQLRCPTEPGEICPLGSQESTYRGWDTSVWYFGSATDLPQLSSNRNSDLNLKPYIKNSTELVVGTGFPGITRFPLDADYPGLLGESVVLTWSLLFYEPSTLSDFVYFDLGDGTTSTETNGSAATLAVVRDDRLAGISGFYVVLKNNVSASGDRVWVRIGSLSVVGGREQTVMMRDGSPSTILSFSVIDPYRPGSDGAGLKWDFLSKNGVAEGSTVDFRGSRTGGTVEVEVTRDWFGPVGSFELVVTSADDVRITFTVTIETVCSAVPGEDLMAGQTGKGIPGDPYQIKRLCQLQDISSNLTAYYELASDIDASETKDWNNGAGFDPIARTESGGFSGSFVNASTHEIRSLTINRSDTHKVGLFSELAENGKIEGIRLIGSRTTGRRNVGSLVGYSNGVIEGSYAAGSVSGSELVGGLVGHSSGNINNGSATGSVFSVSEGYIGGLVGRSDGDISNSYATGSVLTLGGPGNWGDVGGLVGWNEGHINNSYATGSVSGELQGNPPFAGGLVGTNYTGDINNSYATGSVSGKIDVGGLVGVNSGGGIRDSYATGSVSGENNVGGLVGAGQRRGDQGQLRYGFGFRGK